MIQGYHVFKDLATYVSIQIMMKNLHALVNLVHNLSDPYVVAVKKGISGDALVGRVLDQYLQYVLCL